MMTQTSKLDEFIGHVKAGAECRGSIKSMHILKARIIMKMFSKAELKELIELSDEFNGYEMAVFWGIGIRNPARDEIIIRRAERQIANATRDAEI